MKKTVVFLPRDTMRVVGSFPLLHQLEELLEGEIYLMVEKDKLDILRAIPFDFTPIPYEKRQMGNLFEAHRFVANLRHVFNVDLFMGLESGLIPGMVGVNLRAKKRVGLHDPKRVWEKWPYHSVLDAGQKLPQHLTYLDLLRFVNQKTYMDFLDYRIHGLRSGSNALIEEGNFTVLSLCFRQPQQMHDLKLLKPWAEALELLPAGRYVVMVDEEHLAVVRNFFPVLGGDRHELSFFSPTNGLATLDLLGKAKGVFGVESAWTQLSSYMGVPTLLAYSADDLAQTAPFGMEGMVKVINPEPAMLPLSSLNAEFLAGQFKQFFR